MGSIDWDDEEDFELSENDAPQPAAIQDDNDDEELDIVEDDNAIDDQFTAPKVKNKRVNGRDKKPRCSNVNTKYAANISRKAIIKAAEFSKKSIPDATNISLTLDKDSLELIDGWIKKVNELIPDSTANRSTIIRAIIWYMNFLREKKQLDWVTLMKWKPPWD